MSSSRYCPSCDQGQAGSREDARAQSLAGRPRRGHRKSVLTAIERMQIALLVRRHRGFGLLRIRACIPGLPKNAAAAYLRRLKAILRRRRHPNWRLLTWLVPGAVWAIDGTWMDCPVDSLGRRALIVVELHRRKPLALQSVRGERTGDTIALLQRLVDQHGPPLVLKADNGSAFIAQRLASFCKRHGIVLMHSPVRRPRWSGTCEVSGRWAKLRAAAAAAARGSITLSQADLDAAVGAVAPLPPVSGELRARFSEHLRIELDRVIGEQGLASGAAIPDTALRTLTRVAAQRALQLCHILTIEGRACRRWIPTPAA